MESKNEFKKIDIENRMCYYSDDIIRFWDRDIDFSDILLDEKLYKERNEISYKTSMGGKPLRVRFDKMDGLIKIHDKITYLVLFDYGLFDKICDKIKYLISEKGGIKDSINHNFGKIRIDSYNSLPFEKILSFHNALILIKSVANKN